MGEQESDRTLVIVLSIFGVGLFIVAVACYVFIPCNGQNNNGLDNNSQEDTAPDTGNAPNNTAREGNSHGETAAAAGIIKGTLTRGQILLQPPFQLLKVLKTTLEREAILK